LSLTERAVVSLLSRAVLQAQNAFNKLFIYGLLIYLFIYFCKKKFDEKEIFETYSFATGFVTPARNSSVVGTY